MSSIAELIPDWLLPQTWKGIVVMLVLGAAFIAVNWKKDKPL